MNDYHRARRLAIQHGWTLELNPWDSVSGVVRATCPRGRILDGDLHQRVIPYDVSLGGADDKAAAWREAAEEIERGAAGALEYCSPSNESCYLAECFK